LAKTNVKPIDTLLPSLVKKLKIWKKCYSKLSDHKMSSYLIAPFICHNFDNMEATLQTYFKFNWPLELCYLSSVLMTKLHHDLIIPFFCGRNKTQYQIMKRSIGLWRNEVVLFLAFSKFPFVGSTYKKIS